MDSLRILSNLWDLQIDGVDVHALGSNVNSSHRNAVLKWLFESLELLKVGDRVFFATVLLADRFCVTFQPRRLLEGSELQLVILSALCCSLKVVDSSLELTVKAFLEHVSGGHVDPRDIFATEAKILQALDFTTFHPSLSTFIESFYYAITLPPSLEGKAHPLEQPYPPHELPGWALKHQQLAVFLLFLSVFDFKHLHTRRPSELVSACIITSGLALTSETDPAAPNLDEISTLLFRCKWIDQATDVALLVAELTTFWKGCLEEPSEATRSVFSLFDTPERLHVSRMNPKHYSRRSSPAPGIIASGG